MLKGIVAAIAAVMGLALAAPAAATPEDDFLGTLAATPGVTVNGFTGPLLTNAGYQSCDHLRGGQSVDDTTAAMMWYPGATNAGMRALVLAAQKTLCPDTIR